MIRRLEIILIMLALAAFAWWFLVTAVRAGEQHDAPTVRFYDARGNTTGSATRYGDVVKYYGPNGTLLGSSTAIKK
jgi:hypothetical protein